MRDDRTSLFRIVGTRSSSFVSIFLYSVLICLFVLLSGSRVAFGQAESYRESESYQNSDAATRERTLFGSTDTQSAYILWKDQTLAERQTRLDTTVNAIVEFTEPPWTGSDVGPSKQSIDWQHEQFELFVRDAAAGSRTGEDTRSSVAIRRRYTRVLNGMAVTTTRGRLQEIRGLPYVRRVREEHVFHAFDIESIEAVHAGRVFEDFGLTGAGIRIAVIDTGIDYMHADLGGGFGSGFRVRAGYDFVNDDQDPMDDSGHGTHVAGIASGVSSAVPGLAPGSTLMAVKVLDASGSGLESDIIAGIEYAVDPDGNPLTDDGADIINLSLGGPGGPDDPVSRAVDRAVAAGVLCVVAAGNDGDYQRIASPGSSLRALTVGATDNEDRIASFSARGPATNSLAVKPDLVAPGVQINSTRVGGGYRRFSGTSMATPHVSGAAALLMELHPDWSPERVRRALITASDPIGEDVWTQGAGRLNVLRALTADFEVDTANLGFGDVDTGQEIWTVDRQIHLRSLSSKAEIASIQVVGPLPAGLQVSVVPDNAILDPGMGLDITVRITVDNARLGYSEIPPPTAFWIEITIDQSRLRIPASVLKSHRLDLDLDLDPLLVFLLNEQNARILSPGASTRVIVSPGVYDVLTLFQTVDPGSGLGKRSFIFRRGIEVEGKTQLSISVSEAMLDVEIHTKNEAGQALVEPYDSEVIHIEPGNFSVLLLGDPSYAIASFTGTDTGLSVDHLFVERNPGGSREPDRVVPLRLQPENGSGIAENDPSLFQELKYSFEVRNEVDFVSTTHLFPLISGRRVSVSESDPFAARISAPFEKNVLLNTFPSPDFSFIGDRIDVFDTSEDVVPDIRGYSNLIYTGSAISRRTGMIEATASESSRILGPAGSDPLGIAFGASSPFWTATMLEFVLNRIYFAGPPFFLSSFLEARNEISRFEVLPEEGELISSSGQIWNRAAGGLTENIVFEPGSHILTWRFSGHTIDRLPGKTTVSLRFNSNVQTRKPSNLTYMAVLEDGVPDVILDTPGAGAVVIEPEFEEDTLSLSVQRLGSSEWRLLDSADSGQKPVRIPVPSDLEPGFYSLMVRLVSPEGAVMEQRVTPAFRQGRKEASTNRVPSSFQLTVPVDGTRIESKPGQPIRFFWSTSEDADAEDIVWYTLRIEGPGVDTSAVVVSDTSFVLRTTDDFVPGLIYSWSVESTDGLARVSAGSPFSFALAGGATSVDDGKESAPISRMLAPYPNPFTGEVRIVFEQAQPGSPVLDIFDLTGRRVARVVEDHLQPGRHALMWHPEGLPAGIYLARLRLGDQMHYRSLVHVR